jgi:hypothetical protein
MSIEPDSPKKDIEVGLGPGVPTQVDTSAAALERQLQREIDKRQEERFFWIFAITP